MASSIARSLFVAQQKHTTRLICASFINSQRYYSFVSTLSTNEKSPQKFTRCHEVSSEYWKFVDRLKPPAVVPSPTNTENFLSGWTPQPETPPNLPYFVKRTKNHMVPVYLNFEAIRNQRKITMIKLIEGDIWALEQALKAYLEGKRQRPVVSQVHEVAMYIKFRGDYVLDVKDWLLKAGF